MMVMSPFLSATISLMPKTFPFFNNLKVTTFAASWTSQHAKQYTQIKAERRCGGTRASPTVRMPSGLLSGQMFACFFECYFYILI